MTELTRSDWVNNTTIILMSLVPGYSYSDALDIVEAYLANDAGGWVPDDNDEPLGYGEPDNGEAPEEAASQIRMDEFSKVNTLTSTFNVNISIKDVGQYDSGTTANAVFTDLQSRIENRISSLFDDENIVLNSFVYTGQTNTLRTAGDLSQSQRAAVQTEIATASELTDPAAIATVFVRSTFSLDNTWVSTNLYSRENYPIVVYVNKFTNSSYTTRDETFVDGDNTTTYQGYVVFVDPNSMKVQNCLTYPKQTTL